LSAELEVLNEIPQESDKTDVDGVADVRTELAGCLCPMIERLSKEYRDAAALVDLDRVTQQAAATQVGISLSGMKSRVQRTRRELRQMLDDYCVIHLDRCRGVDDFERHGPGCDSCLSKEDE